MHWHPSESHSNHSFRHTPSPLTQTDDSGISVGVGPRSHSLLRKRVGYEQGSIGLCTTGPQLTCQGKHSKFGDRFKSMFHEVWYLSPPHVCSLSPVRKLFLKMRWGGVMACRVCVWAFAFSSMTTGSPMYQPTCCLQVLCACDTHLLIERAPSPLPLF